MYQENSYEDTQECEALFSTYDLGCSAGLMSRGHKLIHLDRGEGSRVLFVFETSDVLIQDSQSYWAGDLDIDALTYFNSIKSLKSQLYSK